MSSYTYACLIHSVGNTKHMRKSSRRTCDHHQPFAIFWHHFCGIPQANVVSTKTDVIDAEEKYFEANILNIYFN